MLTIPEVQEEFSPTMLIHMNCTGQLLVVLFVRQQVAIQGIMCVVRIDLPCLLPW